MIIYHASNASCFLKCMLHKCIYHANDEAAFVGYSCLFCKFFKPDEIYSKIVGYSPLLGPSGKFNDESADKVQERICDLFDDLLLQSQIDIEKSEKIYIGSYYSEFAMYVNIKKIKHSIFE